MTIHIIAPNLYYNNSLKHLDTRPNEPINHNSLVPKVVIPTNKKTLL